MIEITVQSAQPPAGLHALIERVSFGSSGLRYRRLDAKAQLTRFHAPTFVCAVSKDRLVGAYVIDRRSLIHDGQKVPGFYRGLLVVDPSCQGEGIGRRLTAAGFDWMLQTLQERDETALSYGCIDATNQRSLHVLKQQGTSHIGELCRFMMYSQWPREGRYGNDVRMLAGDGAEASTAAVAEALVRKTSADCRWRDITDVDAASHALVIDGTLHACARVSRSRWCIEDMGRFLGWTNRWLVQPYPMARRRFNARSFECLQLTDVGLAIGSEAHWHGFVRTLLARHGLHFAMLLIDPASALHGRLRRIGLLGPLIHGTRPDVLVVARWVGEGVGTSPPLSTTSVPLALAPVDL